MLNIFTNGEQPPFFRAIVLRFQLFMYNIFKNLKHHEKIFLYAHRMSVVHFFKH